MIKKHFFQIMGLIISVIGLNVAITQALNSDMNDELERLNDRVDMMYKMLMTMEK